jgi:ADP-ribosyltransferase exoenzyme
LHGKTFASIAREGESLLNDDEKIRSLGLDNPPPPTAEQIGGLRLYTTSGYKQVNNVLRGGERGPGAFWDDDEVKVVADLADQAMSHLPKYKGAVYRGAHLLNSIVDKYQPGEVITEASFGSTSMKPEVAAKFSDGEVDDPDKTKVTYIINSKNGRNIAPLSLYPEEEEVLMRPSTSFKVLERKKNPKTGHLEIYMDEVD